MSIDLQNKKILVTGGAGFLGSFVVEKLLERGVPRENIFVPRSREIDLRNFENCKRTVNGKDIVIHLAAKVGGIGLDKEKPGELFYDNLIMGTHIMEAARLAGVDNEISDSSIFEKTNYHAVILYFGCILPYDVKIQLDDQHNESKWIRVDDPEIHPSIQTKIANSLKAVSE